MIRFRCFFGCCLARRLCLVKKSSVTETKQDALFCPEVNSAGYSEIEEPIRLRKKHPSATYMLIIVILGI